MMKAREERVLLFRTVLSICGAVSIGAFGAILGLTWGLALGAPLLAAVAVPAVLGAVWGAICFQLTPTGGVIMDNKATVNYAVVALHGWFAAILSVMALIIWGVRAAAG
jgi:hypothetical protein